MENKKKMEKMNQDKLKRDISLVMSECDPSIYCKVIDVLRGWDIVDRKVISPCVVGGCDGEIKCRICGKCDIHHERDLKEEFGK